MSQKQHGCCQCGLVQYSLQGDPLFTYACHCGSCQKRTGSAFSLGMVVLTASLEVEGELTDWSRTSDEGNTNTRYSCAGCGNIIYGIGSSNPDLAKLQPGTLSETRHIAPEVHIWVSKKQAWLNLPSAASQFTTQPDDPTEMLTAALACRVAKD